MTMGEGAARTDVSALRKEAQAYFALAVKAADPGLALFYALEAAPFPDTPGFADGGGRQIVIAVGKAAVPMVAEAMRHLRPDADIILVTNYENAAALPEGFDRVRVFASGHPVPDENGLRAGEAVIAALRGAGAGDRVIALISGGGSALLPAPVEGVSLADKAEVNRLLLSGGLEITQMNLIRQNLSQLKGGGMLRLAAPAPVSAWILSDVIGDDLRTIASGPTVAPLGGRAEARAILAGAGLWERLPASVQTHLSAPDDSGAPPTAALNMLIGSNRKSVEAVRDAAGATALLADVALEGDVGAAAKIILSAAEKAPAGSCLIWGGETTVTLRGDGKGGRNQELALRVALMGERLAGRDWVFLSGGTDGRDGPTEAAGGLVDGGSAARMRARGDPEALLANNDSNKALAASDDLLITGASGTNVADVQILLIG
ncbi:glycerate kinase type-2 family protein [Pseudogemmobacter bohemicus]|uniref:glycerate kinase type-2 family protein n=1 Tax=Pseudogemmobacter bohemicus TaxID=2250708 RepID=UPI001E5CAE17|nr:DUF4147 domain-containing protein [Pseudogemmobacter bohemicus]